MSVSKVVSLEMVLAPAIGNNTPIVDAARQSPQPAALRTELLHQFALVGTLQIRDGAKAALDQPFLVAGPTPKMKPTGLSASIARA